MAKIQVKNVILEYKVRKKVVKGAYRPITAETVGGDLKITKQRYVVKALDNINIEINDGERVGLIGRNGAGKTTLLRVLSGLLPVTSGNIYLDGDVQALFDVNTGMDVELTGYENINFMGLLRGHSKKKIKSYLPQIEEITQLGDYLNMPVYTYSKGMRVRLGIALSTIVQPDVMILDEAIIAGDAHFINKAREHITNTYDKSTIMVLATHSPKLLNELCNRLIWLDKGRIVMDDTVQSVLKSYMK